MSGLFAVNKPSGISSAGLLNDLQHILKKSPLFEPEIRAQQARSNAGRKGRKQKMGNKIKMGHGGTLDPLASGVLVVGTGRGTKDLSRFLSCSKDYEAVALFGCSTDTYDSEGKIVHRRPWKHITRELIESTLEQFRGDIMQTPPIYSALKMEGKPLYEYAREGKPLPKAIQARPANVSHFEITRFTTDHEWSFPKETAPEDIILSSEVLEQLRPRVDLRTVGSNAEAATRETDISDRAVFAEHGEPPQDIEASKNESSEILEPPAKRMRNESPKDEVSGDLDPPSTDTEKFLAIHIDMTVSSGTYVRSLIHDLGLALGSAAHMVGLVRKRVGDFKLEEAISWKTFETGQWEEPLIKRLDFGDQVIRAGFEPQLSIPIFDDTAISHLPPIEQQVARFLYPCRPFSKTLTYAQSLDAKISGPNSKPLTISCPESFRVTHELRRSHDVIVVGVGTALSDDPGLNARDQSGKPYPLDQQPVPVIIDPNGRLELRPESKLMSNFRKNAGKQPYQLVHSSRRDQVQTSAKLIYVNGECGNKIVLKWSDIYASIEHLGKSVMIEGGAAVIQDILRERAADQIIVTVAPTYVGNGTTIDLDSSATLSRVRTAAFGRDAVMAGHLSTRTHIKP